MLKIAVVAYNETLEGEVAETLNKCGLKNYTKIFGAFGRGEASGTHLGNDIWPGRNNILYIACEEKQARELLGYIRELRSRFGREGIKGFILPLEEIS